MDIFQERPVVSAIRLFGKFNIGTPLDAQEWNVEEKDGVRSSYVAYNGHVVEDGCVRIAAKFVTPIGGAAEKPTVLYLPDVEQDVDEETLAFFTSRGYAVLVPDYRGFAENESIFEHHTIYPGSLDHGNYAYARGVYDLNGIAAEESSLFEWVYVALFSVEYLKSREDVGNIGVIGVRSGGAVAWEVMLSSDVKCGIPINAAGWTSMQKIAKHGTEFVRYLDNGVSRYIAAFEAQSCAPYVKCPVLMLCSLRDKSFDCDRAYDTFRRIGNGDENALSYSPYSGECIGPNGLANIQLFLEKNLKGRQIYLPAPLNIKLTEKGADLEIRVECDEEGLLAETGIFYAEADVNTKSVYRDWRCVCSLDGKQVENNTYTYTLKPYAGAKQVFAFAYAKYINGFRVSSKIASIALENDRGYAVRDRLMYSGASVDCFTVTNHSEEAVGRIFLENEIVPSLTTGYAGIKGVYAKGGVRTYRVTSPQYHPEGNDLLQFEGYSAEDQTLNIVVEVGDIRADEERFIGNAFIKGGGKWKRVLLNPSDFKSEVSGKSLSSFSAASALVFDSEEGKAFSITHVLWL